VICTIDEICKIKVVDIVTRDHIRIHLSNKRRPFLRTRIADLDMTFLQQQLSALLLSWIWCCEIGYKSINISEQPVASIYRVITLSVVWLTKDFYPASFEVSTAQQLSIMFSLGMILH